ncbi:FLRT1 protein, partial [Tricholaema leucomelas]|nr:FLRT1 protein [Tricholaema leucomelas]
LAWLRDWLRRRAPPGLQVKGLLCQAPARLRGLAVGELRGEMDACEVNNPSPGSSGQVRSSEIEQKAKELGNVREGSKASGSVSGSLAPPGGGGLKVQAAPGASLRVQWPPAPPGASLRLSWFRPGGGSVTETLVRGERGEYLVRALQPRAPYRVCLSALEGPPPPP